MNDASTTAAAVAALRGPFGFNFSDEQIGPIVAPADGVHAIIAGAGSGKTTVMAARVVWLVSTGAVAPERVLGLTFTNKAAGELGSRIRHYLNASGAGPGGAGPHGVGRDGAEPTVSTYHAFAGQLIAEHGMRLGLEPDLRILTGARRHQLVVRILRAWSEPLRHVGTHVPNVVKDILALDGELSEHDVTTDVLRSHDRATIAEMESLEKPLVLHKNIIATSHKRLELADLVDAYRAAKSREGVMDFSDQMAWGKQLSEIPEVQASLRERFDVILLDEYQDTSVAQRDLLVNLFSSLGVTAVGDPAQGIYGWRGAAAGNLEGFLADFGAPDHREPFTLTTTRRCAGSIIDAANHTAREFYSDGRERFRLRSAPGAEDGRVSIALHETIIDEIADLVERVRAVGEPWRDIGVLVRVARENHELVAAFRTAGIPIEIVGLKGLLSQPEVVDLISTLEVVDDMTANPALLRLLTGPRWRIGDRDLALLGSRASALAAWQPDQSDTDPTNAGSDLAATLDQATEGTDPTEVVSLAEALDDPGSLPYSVEARRRFAELADVLRTLRAHRHEPLVDLARRALYLLELDVELEVAGLPADNLRLLFEAIAGYAQSDPFASLTGLVSFLDAESEYADGLEVANPSSADSVKLLTVHKAKGLEYEHVFVPFVAGEVFPSGQGRSQWITSAKTLPTPLRGDAAMLPHLEDFSSKGAEEYRQHVRRESLLEEIRLGYVAMTRAKSSLHLSGHIWDRTRKTPRKVSQFMADLAEHLSTRGITPEVWADPDVGDAENPLAGAMSVPWPVILAGMDSRQVLADLVRESAGELPAEPDPLIAPLLEDLDLLLAQRGEKRLVVDLPETLSATAAMALVKDEQAFAESLARPMPRRPIGAARGGTRFHAWVESRYGQQSLIDPFDLPGRGETDVLEGDFDDADLASLKADFESGPFADRTPVAIEPAFTLRLGGQQLIGRIDAVFVDDDGLFHVVDWKTNRAASADPLQLAIYRLAWAEQHDLPLDRVRASFHYVRLGEVATYDDLPGRDELTTLLGLA